MVLEHTQTHPPRNHHQNSIGNGEAKELICMIHGHELRGAGWNAGERGDAGWRQTKGRKSGSTVIA